MEEAGKTLSRVHKEKKEENGEGGRTRFGSLTAG